MQYDLLIAIFLLIMILLFYKHLYSIYSQFKWRNRRKKEDIHNVHRMFEDKFTFENFREVWIDVANALELDPEKIRPNDNLNELAQLYPFPEILFDDIEELFIKYGVDIRYIEEKTTLSDLVNIFCVIKRDRKNTGQTTD